MSILDAMPSEEWARIMDGLADRGVTKEEIWQLGEEKRLDQLAGLCKGTHVIHEAVETHSS